MLGNHWAMFQPCPFCWLFFWSCSLLFFVFVFFSQTMWWCEPQVSLVSSRDQIWWAKTVLWVSLYLYNWGCISLSFQTWWPESQLDQTDMGSGKRKEIISHSLECCYVTKPQNFHCVGLAIFELTEICLCFWSAGIKGMCHIIWHHL